MSTPEIPELLTAIRSILNQARTQLQQTVNHTMVQTYWNVGRLIVEHEQKGKSRSDYGQQQICIGVLKSSKIVNQQDSENTIYNGVL